MTINTKISAITLLITATLTLGACAPMPQGSVDPYAPTVTAPPPTINPSPATPLQPYVVQLTASNSASKAKRISSEFTSKGYNAFVSPLEVNGKILHRVQVGMFDNANDAKRVLAQMKIKDPSDPYLADAVAKTP